MSGSVDCTANGWADPTVDYLNAQPCLEGRFQKDGGFEQIGCGDREENRNSASIGVRSVIYHETMEAFLGDAPKMGIRMIIYAGSSKNGITRTTYDDSEIIAYIKATDDFDSWWNPWDGTDDASQDGNV